MTDEHAKLRELLTKATPGPWEWRDDQMSTPEWPVVQWTISPGVLIADTNNGTPGGDEIDQANAALIVSAVNALPGLLDTIERMQAELAEARELLRDAGNQFAVYADLHAAKGTPDAAYKARRNREWADRLLAHERIAHD